MGLKGIKDFIDESKNPGNKRKVSIVDIFLPSMADLNGIRFVDTPGMGSYFRHNTETTMNWTPEAGFSFLSISVERPLSENEMQLLRDLTNYSPKIIILLTKTDLFSQNQCTASGPTNLIQIYAGYFFIHAHKIKANCLEVFVKYIQK